MMSAKEAEDRGLGGARGLLFAMLLISPVYILAAIALFFSN